MILLLFVRRVTKQYLSDEVSKLLDVSLESSFQEIDQCFRPMVFIGDESSVKIAHGEHVSCLELRSHRVDLLNIGEGRVLPLSYVPGTGNESRANPDWFQR